MNDAFFTFRNNYAKNEIRIQAEHNYDLMHFLPINTPLQYYNTFNIASGFKIYDIIPFDDSSNFAISEKLKDILESNKITGWNSFSIKINGINEPYYAFQNLSKAGPILNLDALNNYETENAIFDVQTWDGSDIFFLEYTNINVCTKRVQDIFLKEKITNILIRPL